MDTRKCLLLVAHTQPQVLMKCLKDQNIDACVIGEGEVTLSEIISSMMKNDNQKLNKKSLRQSMELPL